jgi:diacylglycerol kinase family enzyme
MAERFLHVNRPQSGLDYWRGREITIESDPDRPVWTDGEYTGRTPVTATILPGALAVVVPLT